MDKSKLQDIRNEQDKDLICLAVTKSKINTKNAMTKITWAFDAVNKDKGYKQTNICFQFTIRKSCI